MVITADHIENRLSLPSHEGSGLKYFPLVHALAVIRLPSHEGSGLKLHLRS